MATPLKHHKFDENSSKEYDDDSIQYQMIKEEEGMQIQVEFEGRNAETSDYHGIKTLLHQLFLKAHIDLNYLTDLIISQNYVGSVLKQYDDMEEENDAKDTDDVYGITTVINVSHNKKNACISEFRDLLGQLAITHATDAVSTMVKNLLKNDAEQLGLLINERFVNIPTQISIPLFENLISEINRAVNKGLPFNFSYYILICKLYKMEDNKSDKKLLCEVKNDDDESIIWSNPEEEIFAKEAVTSFEFSVEKESDLGLAGAWTEDDDKMMPYRRIVIFEASKLQSIVNNIKSQVA